MKIQAWENHQKAKTEAKMRKIEVCIVFLNTNFAVSSVAFC